MEKIKSVEYLKEKNIPFKLVTFSPETKGVEAIAKVLGVKESSVVKTLVFKGASEKFYLCIAGGGTEIILKKLARVTKEKSISMASPKEIETVTGYIVGAIPAFTLRTKIKVFIEESLQQEKELYVGTGHRGNDIVMTPSDLQKASEGKFIDIIRKEIKVEKSIGIESQFAKTKFLSIQEAIKQGKGIVSIRGWVYRERGSNKLKFITLRDSTNIIQCVFEKTNFEKSWDEIDGIRIETSMELTGEIKKDDRAPTGYEVQVKEYKVIGKCDNFPIGKDSSKEFLADNRHLWLRSRKMTAMLKIRSTVFGALDEFFKGEGFYEYHSPIFQAVQCEGGSELFSVDYFDKKDVFLAQTWQLYAEPAIFALEKIYTIAPSFRAEKSKTSRHLTEYWHCEMEVAWATFKDIQDYGEKMIKFVIKTVLDKHQEELKILERDVSKLEPTVKKPFVRMTYDDALKILADKCDFKLDWGKDLRTVEEEKLVALYDVPVIVTNYPKEVKAFYMTEDPDNPKVVWGCDFLAPEGNGEIIGGSHREPDLEKVKARLVEAGEDPTEYEFYLDTRKYGSVPHAGFGLGVERLIKWICGLDTIKDAIPFPRTMERYKP